MIAWWWVLSVGCAPPPLHLEAQPVDGGVEVVANRPLHRVELMDADGLPVTGRSLRRPRRNVHLSAPITPGGTYEVRGVATADRAVVGVDVPDDGPVRVEVEAPAGQGRRLLGDGERIEVTRIGDAGVDVGLQLVAVQPGSVVLELDGEAEVVGLQASGQRHLVRLRLQDDEVHDVRVSADGYALSATVRSRPRSLQEARQALAVTEVAFPTDALGRPERSRPADRVTLPAPWWRDGLRGLGLGYRPRHDQAPWAWQTVTLDNRDPEPLSVLIRARILDGEEPAPAFQGWVREGRTDDVTALLRVPAGGQATAVLPVYVEEEALTKDRAAFQRVVEVLPLGASEPLHRVVRPLYVTRGSTLASGGFLLALSASLLGYALLAVRGRSWLTERRTPELVTIALFASLTFVVGAAFQALGIGLATVLGPFAPFLTGLFEDALRACLLGTLVSLVPRPGVVSLATVVGFLLRALALGSVHPVDLLYVGSAVFWLESALWISGCTRKPGWRDGSRLAQWLRLGLGLGLANVCATATALVVSVVLYRLYFAAWYVAGVLALPGFLYVLIGSWIAVDFAAALRRVEA